MPIIRPDDVRGLSEFGALYVLNSLQPLRGYELVKQSYVDRLRSNVVTHVDVVEILTGLDHGRSTEKTVILTMPCPGSIDGATLLQAVWCGYMLSLNATMEAGDDRAHVGYEEDAVELATAMTRWIGAVATPCAEVYGSEGTYLEALEFTYDATTRTLRVVPSIGE